ncbi:hypothetical protein AVEN_254060-1 [Araneus ventricosus]|uniref:Uncharacterized protein n=1 Tax=Araneus ventricosus TaxID=182803 RepID=A0A4Y2BXW1_ARAVE|nr:hypothetical protein AVEN_254060-1 [Araneus ventricosus]
METFLNCISNPVQPDNKFFLIDTVQIIKSVKNNWFNEKTLGQVCFPSPDNLEAESVKYVAEQTQSLQNISSLKKNMCTHQIKHDMFYRTIKAKRSLCHAFSLHISRNAASRDWSNGKNNSPSLRGLRESHAFIGADVTGDEDPKQAR